MKTIYPNQLDYAELDDAVGRFRGPRTCCAYSCPVRVAQWIARLPPKQKVAGSNPASDVIPFCFDRGQHIVSPIIDMLL